MTILKASHASTPLHSSTGAEPHPGEAPERFQLSPAVKSTIRVLIVEDDRTLREGCAGVLRGEGYNVTTSDRGDEAIELVRQRRFDLVLVDLYMTPASGLEVLKATLEANRGTIVVVMTGNPTVQSSIDALRHGAWDYLPKPFSATHLEVLLGRAVHAIVMARETEEMRLEMLRRNGNSDKITLLGVSPCFRKAVDLARKVAATNASVMISGESGTGKELIAQFIHHHSRRASRKLVPINCAALPEPLLESELFGHRKGAFTGADREKPGLLEAAHGGTLFLDELSEMSHPIQAKLLRVLQDGVVRRVGSEQQDAVVDVRFISATNRDPHEAVGRGALREDLFYRLNVVPIRLPSLRERLDDIPLLANHFLSIYWARHRQRGSVMPKFSEATMDFLCAQPWRGNVRELQNVIEHLAVLAEPGESVEPTDMPIYDASQVPVPAGGICAVPEGVLDAAFHAAKDQLVAHFEKEYLTRLAVRANGNMTRAARLASIDRTTLYRLMEKHGLHRATLSGTLE